MLIEREKSLLLVVDVQEKLAPAIFEGETAIKNNTQLLNSMGVESVPYIMAKHAASGQVVTNAGAMETAALAKLLGVEIP